MATKISALSTNATPAGTAVVPAVDSGTTSKVTIEDAVRYGKRKWNGWFNVTNTTAQTGIGTTETVLTISGAASNVAYLPSYLDGGLSDVLTSGAGAKVLFGNMPVGSFGMLSVCGELTTDTNNTAASLIWKYFDSSDSEVLTHTTPIGFFKSSGSGNEWTTTLPFYVDSTLAADGYLQMFIQFDTGSANAVTVSDLTGLIELM